MFVMLKSYDHMIILICKICFLLRILYKLYLMKTLFILHDISTNGYSDTLLDLFSFISTLCGIFVILTKNPVISLLFLICLFLSIASYLMLLGMKFIGLSYLLVYIGAISILFLFILMLINVRISELQTDTNKDLPLAIFISVCLYSILYKILPNTYNEFIFNISSSYKNLEKINYITSNIWDGNLIETSHITTIGNIMYTNYFLWLILTSIILLLAMVGAIVITIKS